jgi:hypothetical protein
MIALNKTNSPPVIPSVAETHHFYAAAAKRKFFGANPAPTPFFLLESQVF